MGLVACKSHHHHHARAALRAADHQMSPMGLLCGGLTYPVYARLPPALQRMWAGMRSLPAPRQLSTPDNAPRLPPDDWCLRVPLWGNPLLRQPGVGCLEIGFADIAATTIRYLPDLQRVHRLVATTEPAQYTEELREQLFGRTATHRFADQHTTLLTLRLLLDCVPSSWKQYLDRQPQPGEQPPPQPPCSAEHQATATVLDTLGWPASDNAPAMPLSQFRVRGGTARQLAQPQARRRQLLAVFVALATSDPQPAAPGAPLPATPVPPPDAVTAAAAELQRTLTRLWRLPWDNTHKEVYWRLALNGLPLASRMPPTPRPCQCGSHDPHPGRLHHYWTCPAAVAVADAVSTALGGVPLTRSNLWLARPPPGIHRGVWDVTCLASLAAMDGGRRMMVARSMAAPPDTPPDPALPAAAARHAVARLWILLEDFCSVGTAPFSWRAEVPPTHPLLRWDALSSHWRLVRAPE